MIIKIKSFIYRFFNIFGLSVYLADKEEQAYIDSLGDIDEFTEDCSRGLWQGKNGFTSIWTGKKPIHKALVDKIKHAFDFRSF